MRKKKKEGNEAVTGGFDQTQKEKVRVGGQGEGGCTGMVRN